MSRGDLDSTLLENKGLAMSRLKGGVDHSVKYPLKALESNPFDPELRERVDATI